MIIKIWTLAQIQELCGLQVEYKIPLEVIKFLKRQTAILDTEYGMGRDVDSDDGGCVLLLLLDKNDESAEHRYLEVLKEYHLRQGTAEIERIIRKDGCLEWHSDLFLTTNDYGITVVYPLKWM